ncbi:hypothetical protein AYY17_14380 [Morganella psychrotolerans]|uniref:Uncharacterized protein n=1 Tax=Morganella psychrotolerans TaxID=368603 RepID=A0A1B8HN05_9GAMM|nr:hypothetical protein AYY17_14380 [Morganella psychrotolerans]
MHSNQLIMVILLKHGMSHYLSIVLKTRKSGENQFHYKQQNGEHFVISRRVINWLIVHGSFIIFIFTIECVFILNDKKEEKLIECYLAR